MGDQVDSPKSQEQTYEVPIVNIEYNADGLNKLKQKCIETIISHKIISDEDLDTFFRKTKEANQITDGDYQQLVSDVKNELDG